MFPKKEGHIQIIGLRYVFNGVIPCFRAFTKQGRRLNDTTQQRLNVMYTQDQSLHLVVTPPMPVLDVAFHSFPDSLLSGEVLRCVLEINNKGNCGLKNLKVKISHPSFFSVGSPNQMETPVYGE